MLQFIMYMNGLKYEINFFCQCFYDTTILAIFDEIFIFFCIKSWYFVVPCVFFGENHYSQHLNAEKAEKIGSLEKSVSIFFDSV